MIPFWQEIATFVILGTAVFFLARRYFFPPRRVKGAGADECAPCSTGSCDGCAIMDLKKEIDMNSETRKDKMDSAILLSEAEGTGTSNTRAADSEGMADKDTDTSATESASPEKEYRKMCQDACIQVRRMGLK
jgi:hypothetical protein